MKCSVCHSFISQTAEGVHHFSSNREVGLFGKTGDIQPLVNSTLSMFSPLRTDENDSFLVPLSPQSDHSLSSKSVRNIILYTVVYAVIA